MASPAHCAYCFESLSASLEKRQPLDLRQVQLLWKQYHADPAERASPLGDLEVTPPSDSEPEDAAIVNADGTPYRPAAISRLLVNPSPSSASSSSVQSTSSTPSRVSEASSATSKSSSRSSFFSLGRKLKQEQRRADYAAGDDEDVDDHPLFVTWNTVQASGDTRLRGCIGTFEPHELDDGLRSYALTSAFDDTRFNPITLRELASLECGVTLLTNFEPISNPMDWSIGTHGLRINFTHHGRRYGSTYLPDVAKEQGWTKEETMVSLMRKAGWNGDKRDWKKVELNVIRYQGKQVKLEYPEWREWRDWVEAEEVEL
ncbi:AMMECR1-domain-containing protein [Amniculicola lignicola CBS 123094]|uniref:AMMECR1-domain-containing protein n=1 Tax=Amniculicola lignicola CBS 123094 TaxID=1392246 RepID=A0A6A5WRY4_9PLEO|nr:AMMECR1-domain-containing protein [Amniculicola lignicola CBS 123094]